MASLAGRHIGTYDVLEHIGSGGMGEVYRAHDSILGRDVALKFLPSHLATDHDRLQRFTREAQTLAALNHPNIAQIFGLEQADDTCCIAMELVDGETLADRTRRGSLPAEEALRFGRDIAAALEAAHDKGIVHRDLKPANVKISRQGQVKVLDFGLAKVRPTVPGHADVSDAVTASLTTKPGIAFGTPGYMSPEQARGEATDQRTDIFSFGSVLYEMLTGQPAFAGQTAPEIVASVLAREPNLSLLPRALNPKVCDLVQRCLEKDLRQRWQAIGDVRIELEAICKNPRGADQDRSHAKSLPKRLGPLVLTAVVAAGGTFGLMWTIRVQPAGPPPEAGMRRFSIPFGEARPVISPDGHHIAYRADDRLWVRDLDSETPREIPGGKATGGYYSDVGYYLTWSPDSRSIAFPAGNELRRVSILQGGSATTVCTLPGGRRSGRQVGGVAWSADGKTIVFSRYQGGVYEVASGGGSPTLLWKQDHVDDVFLVDTPQGRAIVYAVLTPQTGHAIMVYRPDGQQEQIAQIDANWPELQYSPTGHILFRKNPTENPSIWALPFSATTLRADGAPFLVERSGQGMSVAQDGTFVYLDTGRMARQFLAWRDLDGRILGQAREGHEIIDFVRLSPLGNQAVVTATENGRSELWIYNLELFNRTRFDLGPDAGDRTVLAAIWPRPGSDLFYSLRSDAPENGTDMFVKAVDGLGEARRVSFPRGLAVAQDRTSDGQYLVAGYSARPGEAARLWFLQNDSDGRDGHAVNFSQNSETETSPALSPNNRYIAYTSTIGGGVDVYVRPFPGGPGRWQISTGGGVAPRWKSDGTQLFFADGNTLMRVDVTTENSFAATSAAVPMFEHPTLRGIPAPFARYDVALDGRRFLTVESQRDLDRPVVRIVENWSLSLREQQPPAR